MDIRMVKNKRDLLTFIHLPQSIYRNDPVWVPPLRSDIESQFDPRRNPFLDHCRYRLFLLENGGKITGRIAAFYDTLANDFWGRQVGLFGYYECPENPTASRLLLGAAASWLRGEGMDCIRGPWSFVSQEWGAVVEGFTPSPVVMAPYNPPYYNDQFTAFGLQKTKDLLVYAIDARKGYTIPARILELTDRVAEKYGIRVRPIRMDRLQDEVETIMQVSNASLEHNWGYSPVTDDEVRAMAHDLKPVIHPKTILFAETHEGKPVAFAIAIPDVNIILKQTGGRMLPFGWLKLLLGLPRLKHYRMFALGVIPEYQGKAIDSLLYRGLYEAAYSQDLFLEINYVLEDNDRMNNAILKLGAKPLRRYRVYESGLPAV